MEAFVTSITGEFATLTPQIMTVAGVGALFSLTLWGARKALRVVRSF